MTARPCSPTDAGPCADPVPGPHSLPVDSGEFYAAIAPAILAARRRVYLQVMTFELDRVGARLWQLLARSSTACKILCVDAFSRILQPALSRSNPIPPPPRRPTIAVALLLLRTAETIIRKIPHPDGPNQGFLHQPN